MIRIFFYFFIIPVIIIFFNFNNLYAQDTIITVKNEMIKCNIVSEDSIIVIYRLPYSYYNEDEENRIIKDNIIDRKEIKIIKYAKKRNILPVDKSSIGLGLGLDYGGFGINFSGYPNKILGICGGFGFNSQDFMYNAGIKLRMIKDSSRASYIPYILVMYGINATIRVENMSSFNKNFSSVSFGFGIDFLSDELPQNYWGISVIYPYRKEAEEYLKTLSGIGVKFQNSFFPITISIGYRIAISTF